MQVQGLVSKLQIRPKLHLLSSQPALVRPQHLSQPPFSSIQYLGPPPADHVQPNWWTWIQTLHVQGVCFGSSMFVLGGMTPMSIARLATWLRLSQSSGKGLLTQILHLIP